MEKEERSKIQESWGRINAAEVLLFAGEVEAAREQLRLALELNSRAGKGHYLAAILAAEDDDPRQVAEEYALACRLDGKYLRFPYPSKGLLAREKVRMSAAK
jgi:hypothetical protein